MNTGLQRKQKGAVVADFEALSRQSPDRTEDVHDGSLVGVLVDI
jgi:hypothetical protein